MAVLKPGEDRVTDVSIVVAVSGANAPAWPKLDAWTTDIDWRLRAALEPAIKEFEKTLPKGARVVMLP